MHTPNERWPPRHGVCLNKLALELRQNQSSHWQYLEHIGKEIPFPTRRPGDIPSGLAPKPTDHVLTLLEKCRLGEMYDPKTPRLWPGWRIDECENPNPLLPRR